MTATEKEDTDGNSIYVVFCPLLAGARGIEQTKFNPPRPAGRGGPSWLSA
jgi:hypothetical protein